MPDRIGDVNWRLELQAAVAECKRQESMGTGTSAAFALPVTRWTILAVADALAEAERERDEARALAAGATAEADERTEDALRLAGELAEAEAEVKRLRVSIEKALAYTRQAQDHEHTRLPWFHVSLVAEELAAALADPAPEGQG